MRILDATQLVFYRAVRTENNDTVYFGPYDTIGAAKSQGRSTNWSYSTPDHVKVQKLGIDIEDFPDDIIAKLAWFDVAELVDGKWVDISV